MRLSGAAPDHRYIIGRIKAKNRKLRLAQHCSYTCTSHFAPSPAPGYGLYWYLFFRQYHLHQALLQHKAARYSNTHQCWYTEWNEANCKQLLAVLNGIATINQQGIYPFPALQQERHSGLLHTKKTHTKATSTTPAAVVQRGTKAGHIYPVNAAALTAMKQQLILKAYSPSTIRTYLNEMRAFLQTIR